MALTRSKVEAHLRTLADMTEGRGIAVAGRYGEELSGSTVDYVYRDVRRCIFCGNTSAEMSADMVALAPPMTQLFSGPNVRHARLLFYGLCRSHQTRAAKDREFWGAKLRKHLEHRLMERINDAARSN